MTSELDNYYTNKSSDVSECLLAMRAIVGSHALIKGEAWKWKLPFFYSENGKNVCYFHVEKKTGRPYICFIKGDLLNEFHTLEKDGRKTMVALKMNPNEDIPKDLIFEIMNVLLIDYNKNN